MAYWIAETSANSYPMTRDNWEKTKATTIKGAKSAARQKQTFQGTSLYIAQGENKDNLRLVAFATADALNFAYKAIWVNCD
jgi:queuine/archaeosine tRNA-ribosyltransferase